ncbi:MAG TPA: glycosyltransferase, partial [Methylocella sp.]|nr:glycosyltransferase [Methylocella sp.]
WLCFLDADTRAEPALLASAVATARGESLDLLSLAPRQNLVSFAERLVLPCGLYFLSFSQKLAKLQSQRSGNVTVTGQFMLVRSCTYWAVGGHAAVPFAICEDIALARLVKRSGGRVKLYDGQRLISTRMYTGWETLWPGIAKNLVDMLGGPLATVACAVVAVTLAWAAWLIPILSGVSCAHAIPGACVSLLPAIAGSASAIGLHLAGAAYFRIPFWYGLLFPFGYTVGAAIALDSILRRFRGQVTWKGRIYS